MQTPKKFSSFSDQVSWISDEKGIKIKDREYAEEMLRQIGYFPLMGGYKHLFRILNTKKYKAGTSFEEKLAILIVSFFFECDSIHLYIHRAL